MEVTERKRGPQKNGGKIGSGKLRRQEKLIASLRDKCVNMREKLLF